MGKDVWNSICLARIIEDHNKARVFIDQHFNSSIFTVPFMKYLSKVIYFFFYLGAIKACKIQSKSPDMWNIWFSSHLIPSEETKTKYPKPEICLIRINGFIDPVV